MTQMWIVRKSEDAWKIAPPQVADAIAETFKDYLRGGGYPTCAHCGEDHFGAAVMAFREPESNAIQTMGVCAQCANDERTEFSGWARNFMPKPVLVRR